MTFTLDPKDDRVKYDGFRMTVAEDVISVVAKAVRHRPFLVLGVEPLWPDMVVRP